METKSRKSSATNGRKSSRLSQSPSISKRRRSSRRSTSTQEDETLEMKFIKYCARFKTSYIPQVQIIPFETPIGAFPSLSSTNVIIGNQIKEVNDGTQVLGSLYLIYDDYITPTFLNAIIMKNSLIERSLLIALRKSIHKFDTLKILKLEYCNLTFLNLRTLKTILRTNETITDLSINGNPNKVQNHFILLKNTKLINLTMRFCKINDRGINLIAEQLKSASDSTIVSINLSSNFISDVGVKSIVQALRINRILISVNLADNWITDVGCMLLMSALQKFELEHEEIVIRRNRKIDWLLRKHELIEAYKLKLLQASETMSITSKSSTDTHASVKKLSKDSNSHKRRSSKGSRKGRSPTGSIQRKNSAVDSKKTLSEIDLKAIEELIESQMVRDKHPFVKDSFPENMAIYCLGNFKLLHLNLAYNRITINGILSILEMSQYQQITCSTFQGISHIILEGNIFEENCNEITEIENLLINAHVKKSIISHESSHSEGSRRKTSV